MGALVPLNRKDTHRFPEKTSGVTITDLICAAPGRAGLHLNPSPPEMGTQAILTGVYGPLPEGTIGLIWGRNNMTLKGLQIHPGVVDQNFTGKLTILVQAPQTFVADAPTDKMAQLVILPNVRVGKVLTDTPQGEKGFGHSDHV
jgi:dUTPase